MLNLKSSILSLTLITICTGSPTLANQCRSYFESIKHRSASDFARQLLTEKNPNEVIQKALSVYPELAWLTGKVDATPEGKAAVDRTSPSEAIFGQKHIEFDRTATGILILKWILEGNYEAFTQPQDNMVKMTREKFNNLREYTKSILKTKADIDAMVTYMVINDLGKIKSIVSEIERKTGVQDVDHDNILLTALEKYPQTSPSFQRLSKSHKARILKGLRSKFNIAQFIQGENVPASLINLKDLDQASLDFYLLHAIADIGGAAGHANSRGSVVMTNPTYEGFEAAVNILNRLKNESFRNEQEAYVAFLNARTGHLGLNANYNIDYAQARLAAMLRISDRATFDLLKMAFDSLDTNARLILIRELNASGSSIEPASLLYYSPAVLANLIAAYKQQGVANHYIKAVRQSLNIFAELYQLAKIHTKNRKGGGVFTVMVSKIAKAAKNPELLDGKIELREVGNDAEAVLVPRSTIQSSQFLPMTLRTIRGSKIGVIGIGGGSDGIQAAQLGLLLRGNGKKVPFVISVRTDKTGSQGSTGKLNEVRTITNHGGEIADGVYIVRPDSQGSGRFLENIPAAQIPMFLVIDKIDGQLTAKIQKVIDYVGGVETVIAVDTGGDSLYSPAKSQKMDHAVSTPDQDLRVIESLNHLKVDRFLTAIVAAGIDSPSNAQEVLRNASAEFFTLSPSERNSVLKNYDAWDMTGANDKRYGKTALAWQMALQGLTGKQVLPLPSQVVMDEKNPWNPFVTIDSSMAGIFFMIGDSQLRAIRTTKTPEQVALREADPNQPTLVSVGLTRENRHTYKGLYLITSDEFAKLPNGTKLYDIYGDISVKGRDHVDLQTRYGYISYGFYK